MKLAISGTEVPAADGIAPLVDACTTLGVGWVELWYPRNTERLGTAGSLAQLADKGIGVSCISTATELGNPGDPSEAQQTIIESIEIAAEVGCPTINTYFGWPEVRDDVAAAAAYARNLVPCLRVAERTGVVICLENEFDTFECDPLGTDLSRRPEELVRLVETVGSDNFRLTFDACNAYIAGLDVVATWELVSPYVASMHAKDAEPAGPDPVIDGWTLFHDEGRAFLTCPLGEGGVGWKDLLDRVAGSGYDGTLNLEPHTQPTNRMAAWQQAVSFLRAAVPGCG